MVDIAENRGKKEALGALAEALKPDIDIRKLYATWAATYDQDLGAYAEVRRRHVRGITQELFNQNGAIKILDAGAGTGIVAEVLREAGYQDIDALDANPDMLEIAKSKNVYNRIICDYLGPSKLDINDGTYDMVICMGSLLSTHINEDAFEEMIRITKKGGYVVFLVGLQTIGEAKADIDAAMQKLHDEGKWEWVIKRILDNYHDAEDPKGLLYAFKIKHEAEKSSTLEGDKIALQYHRKLV